MSWLTNQQLEKAILQYVDIDTKKAFLGVFPLDKLPTVIKRYPVLLIVNTHPSNLGGEHWFAIFISKLRYGEIFDSAAQPIDLRVRKWLNVFTNGWKRNELMFQSLFSSLCGAYVLYYVLNRLRYSSMHQLLFPKQRINDLFIRNWYHKLTSKKKL